MIIITVIGLAASLQLMFVSGMTHPIMTLIGLVLFVLNGVNFLKELKKGVK